MNETTMNTAELLGATYSPHAIQLGTMRVTAIYDGHFDLPRDFIASPDHAPDGETFHLDVNTFLIQNDSQNILIDTGAGAKLGPTANKLTASLAAAGLAPADIDTVLCTHIHPDHTNGLVDMDNLPVFPNAHIFVHQNEIAHWLTDEAYAQAAEDFRYVYDWARESFAPYKGRIEPFLKGEILPGIEAIPLYGHTPGHTGYHIDGGGTNQLLVWGDAVHNIDVQARNPLVGVQADVSQDEARSTRLALFDRAAADDLLVTGMHVTFPGFGRLRKDGAGYDYSLQG